MPPGYWSRYRFCDGLFDGEGRVYLSERVPFIYRELPDTIEVITNGTDTLDSLAARHYAALTQSPGLKDPSELWWIIADFQPDPAAECMTDPTIVLIPANLKVYIPSPTVVTELIFAETRRIEHEG
jgi:hypothetical protein